MGKWTRRIPLPGIAIDPTLPVSLERQIYSSLRQAIRERRLRPGMRLPSSRVLADQLRVPRNAVIDAFRQLSVEGFLRSQVGSGTYVAETPLPNATRSTGFVTYSSEARGLGERTAGIVGARAFTPGLTALDLFPRRRWIELVGESWGNPTPLFSAEWHRGLPQLRKAIADHVAPMRGIGCDPDEIVITSGFEQSLRSVARVILDPGSEIAVQSPCDRVPLTVFESLGLTTVKTPVDGDGFRIGENIVAKCAYLTPGRHEPLGTVTTPGRRYALLEWARNNGALIIEDDRDCGLQTAPQSPALKAIDHRNRVVYIGSLERSMYRGLGIGFVIAPAALAATIARAVALTGSVPAWHVQEGLARFISEGDFAFHVDQMRNVYAARENELEAELRRQLGGSILGVTRTGGIQLLVWLAPGLDDAAIAAAAELRGLAVTPLSASVPDAQLPPALLLGYGAVRPEEMREAVGSLASVFESTRSALTA